MNASSPLQFLAHIAHVPKLRASQMAHIGLTLALLFILGCGQKNEDIDTSALEFSWAPFIHSHSSGAISTKGNVHIRFTKPIIEQANIGESFAGELSFEPAISGSAKWISTSELEFTPSKPLTPGQSYQGILTSKALAGVPADLAPYRFAFEAITQAIHMNLFSLHATQLPQFPDSVSHTMQLSGEIKTADLVDTSLLEKSLQATQKQGSKTKSLPIDWVHNPQTQTYQFTISQIMRQPTRGSLQLSFNSKLPHIDWSKEQTIPVPAIGEFSLMNITTVNNQQQYIHLRFSDPPDPGLNLEGLIQLQPYAPVRFVREANDIKVFFVQNPQSQYTLIIDKALRSTQGNSLPQSIRKSIHFALAKPEIRWSGKGTVLPHNNVVSVAFEAKGLKAVRVKALKVFEDNMGHFLQVNRLQDNNEMHRVGRYLWEKRILLTPDSTPRVQEANPSSLSSPPESSEYTRYYLDLEELTKHKGSLFRLELSFTPEDSDYPCPSDSLVQLSQEKREKFAFAASMDNRQDTLGNWDENMEKDASSWDYWEQGGYWYGRWNNKDNPCSEEYYNPSYNKNIVQGQNFISSNIGLIAKQGENDTLYVVATSLDQASPLQSATINVYNFQNQVAGTAQTNKEGFAKIALSAHPYYIQARFQNDVGYLKISQGNALASSHFDVGGTQTPKGLKGFIYGERGVWRPGDSLYLTFVLQDQQGTFPTNHPVHFSLKNPQNQVVYQTKSTKNMGGFYSFKTATAPNALTGSYTATVQAGGLVVQKEVKIETIMPNRLKIELDVGKDTLSIEQGLMEASIFSQWLHGASAQGLKSDVSVLLSESAVAFSRFSDYTFNDPTRSFSGYPNQVWQGTLNDQGKAELSFRIQANKAPAGMLRANFTTRVFEASGGFSTENFSVPYHPYSRYIGIKMPKGDQARGMLLTDTLHKVSIAAVQKNGSKKDGKVRVRLMKINWRWWWEKGSDDLSRFAYGGYNQSIKDTVIQTHKGLGVFPFEIKYPQWGRYLLQACDEETPDSELRHCTGKVFYIDWPGWAGKAREEKGVSATMLSVTTDKPLYNTGDKATLKIPVPAMEQSTAPGSPAARALISIESGSQIISQHWMQAQAGNNTFTLNITPQMAPNVYAHVTVIQPHSNKQNDRPIRLYGIVPIMVQDPLTHLQPHLEVPEQVKPNSTLNVKVSEKHGKPMYFTLAVVDEGLLGLTRYTAPNLHSEFYKKEAHGVRTWDIYDDVIGAYGTQLQKLLALGGDDDGNAGKSSKQNRFPPLVRFYGPFLLAKGKTESVSVPIPQYVGAVRAMVVAGNIHNSASASHSNTATKSMVNSYGSASKTIVVKQPLMIQSLLPRVLSPGEVFTVPVTVFAMENSVQGVTVSVQNNKHFTIPQDAVNPEKTKMHLQFSKPGEKVTQFTMQAPEQAGTYSFTVQATSNTSGKQSAQETIHITVRHANLPHTTIQKAFIDSGAALTVQYTPHGLAGTNTCVLELSSIPPLGLQNHLQQLIHYPHGCVEQTTSKALAQLYLPNLMQINQEQKQQISANIQMALNKIHQFQTAAGSFTYWPGAATSGDWVSSYVGHFVLQAKDQGYGDFEQVINKWLSYQKETARTWNSSQDNHALSQAYRLYTLALAGQSELGAMNRLREYTNRSTTASLLLAAAYSLAGQDQAAKELTKHYSPEQAYHYHSHTYGSPTRDMALELFSLTHLPKTAANAQKLAQAISNNLDSNSWYSTQSTAWSLLALAKYYKAQHPSDQTIQATWQVTNQATPANPTMQPMQTMQANPNATQIQSNKPVYTTNISKSDSSITVLINNAGKQRLYARLYATGIPPVGNEVAFANTIKLTQHFTDLQNNPISPASIQQGTDFLVKAQIYNPGKQTIANMALTQVFPGGWEITNQRLAGAHNVPGAPQSSVPEYLDIQDDRVHTYFALRPNETKTFTVYLHAAYPGQYYLPAVCTEDMYDITIKACTKGQAIEVTQ